MVYRRRGKLAKRVTKIAKGKDTAIKTLAKAVSAIKKRTFKQVRYLNFQQTGEQVSLNATPNTNPNVLNLSQYNAYGWSFGTAADDNGDNKLIHQSFGIDSHITMANTINNEEENVRFTCFLVSLKDPATQIFNFQTNTFTWNSSPATANQTHAWAGGLVMLNKKYFTIHKIKRFCLGNNGTALANPSAQTQYGTDIRFYIKHSPNALIENPGGNVIAMQNAADPSKQYFMLIFTDNSAADVESPSWTYAVVHKFKTLA